MSNSKDKISKLISFWLRHKPEEANLELDEFGWTRVDNIINALKANNINFSKDSLIELNNSFDKVRWKIDLKNQRIKATHGHSIPISQELEPQVPNEILYHGTAAKNLIGIIKNGLKSGQRQYVHLSETIEMATEVGKRHGKPFIVEVSTKELIEDGWKFYKTEENVWLTTNIPIGYLDFKPWHFKTDDKGNDILINELKMEVSNHHLLSGKLDELKIFAYHLPSDDCLFKRDNSNQYYLIHPTWSGKKEGGIWPSTDIFETIEDWVEKRLVPDQNDYY